MNSKLNFIALLCAAIFSTGCASYVAPQGAITAPLTLHMHNDSTWITLLTATSTAYDDDKCTIANPGNRILGRSIHMKPVDVLTTAQIPVGKPFTFSIDTNEARAALNTGCSATATFFPEAGMQYRALFSSRNNAKTCDIVMRDQQNRTVPLTSPEYNCSPVMPGGVTKNGTGWARAVDIIIHMPMSR